MRWFELSLLLSLVQVVAMSADDSHVIDNRLYHLRSGDRGWEAFRRGGLGLEARATGGEGSW